MFKIFRSMVKSTKQSLGHNSAKPMIAKELLEMQKIPEVSPNLSNWTNSNIRHHSNRVNSPQGVDSKVLAKTAAARIDAIEKEIALDLRGALAGKIGIHLRANKIASRYGINRIAPPKGVVVSERHNENRYANYQTIMPGMSNSMLLGDTNLNAVIDVTEGFVPSAIEEAVVLYATGQLDGAINTIVNVIQSPETLGDAEYTAYCVLFDLLRQKKDFKRFDSFAIDFVKRFEKSPPTWHLPIQTAQLTTSTTPTLDLGEMLDASIVPVLGQLKIYSHSHRQLRLNVGDIRHINFIDGFGCELLMRVLTAFEATDYQLSLVGIDNLFIKLRPLIQSKQRHISGHVWMLYLELLRLQSQQLLFEDIALKFAILYEVSPPSWREPVNQLFETDKKNFIPKTIMVFDRPDHIKLSGTIKSNRDDLIKQIAYGLHDNSTVVCDCSDLVLVDFDSAGRLLTALTAWSAELKTVEFRNVSSPIATLFIVLGIHHLAVVERRKEI